MRLRVARGVGAGRRVDEGCVPRPPSRTRLPLESLLLAAARARLFLVSLRLQRSRKALAPNCLSSMALSLGPDCARLKSLPL
eukprot:scaffold57409_cov32-Tisochrysis_lutea.AAC.2